MKIKLIQQAHLSCINGTALFATTGLGFYSHFELQTEAFQLICAGDLRLSWDHSIDLIFQFRGVYNENSSRDMSCPEPRWTLVVKKYPTPPDGHWQPGKGCHTPNLNQIQRIEFKPHNSSDWIHFFRQGYKTSNPTCKSKVYCNLRTAAYPTILWSIIPLIPNESFEDQNHQWTNVLDLSEYPIKICNENERGMKFTQPMGWWVILFNR